MTAEGISLQEVLASAPRRGTAVVAGWHERVVCQTCGGNEIASIQQDLSECPCGWQASVVAENVRVLLARLGYERKDSLDLVDITGDWAPARTGAPVLTVFWRFLQDPHDTLLRRSTAKKWIAAAEESAASEPRHVIIIHRKRRAPVAELMAEREVALGWRIDFWDEDSLLFTPGVRGLYHHEHRVLGAAELKRLEAVFQLDAGRLPVLFSSDPAAKWCGARPGDVVAVESTFMDGKQQQYRRCVYLAEERFRKESIVAKKADVRDRHNRFL
eukprot:g65285.t1